MPILSFHTYSKYVGNYIILNGKIYLPIGTDQDFLFWQILCVLCRSLFSRLRWTVCVWAQVPMGSIFKQIGLPDLRKKLINGVVGLNMLPDT